MRKKHYRICKIRDGEDTPCKECDVFWDNRHCSGNCSLIRRWKYIPTTVLFNGRVFNYERIKGYIYKRIRN